MLHRRGVRLRDRLPLGVHKVLAAIGRGNKLGRGFRQVDLPDVLHQPLHVRKGWHAAPKAGTSAPDARKLLLGGLHERFIHAAGDVRDAVLHAVERVLELVVALVPAALVHLFGRGSDKKN